MLSQPYMLCALSATFTRRAVMTAGCRLRQYLLADAAAQLDSQLRRRLHDARINLHVFCASACLDQLDAPIDEEAPL